MVIKGYSILSGRSLLDHGLAVKERTSRRSGYDVSGRSSLGISMGKLGIIVSV